VGVDSPSWQTSVTTTPPTNEGESMDRHDIEMCGAWAQLMALEVAVTALLGAHPNREALAGAWRVAEDRGFTWTSDANGVDQPRFRLIQEQYLQTLNRLRSVAIG